MALLVVVVAASSLSLAAFAPHLVHGQALPFPGGAAFAVATEILVAICVRRK